MKQAIQILGMTCQGCRKGVEEKLATIVGVSKVSVSLEQASAEFETKEILDVASISAVLGEKYTVDNLNENSSTPPADSKWKQLRPLFLIFGYVIAGSFLLSRGQDIAVFMQYFMGLFYIVFSFFKLLDYRGFPASFQQYDPIAKRLPVYGWVYPFIETVLGLAFHVVVASRIGFVDHGLYPWEHYFGRCATTTQKKQHSVCLFRYSVEFTHDRGYLG